MIDSEPSWSGEPAIDRPKTLLYVDDHALDLALMRALLSQRPAWRLNMACDGEAACMIARRESHDLLLLDLRMPDCTGTELLRKLRALPGLSAVPAIAVTSEDFPDFSDAGFHEVLPKPLNLRLTMSRLDHFLGEAAASANAGARDAPVPDPMTPPAGPGCTTAAAVAGRFLDRVKSQASALPAMSPALRSAR